VLSNKKGKQLNKYVSDYVVFDLETTGISPMTDEVVEISAIKVKDGEVVDEFSTLVNPGRPIPYGASAVNGITDDMVANSPGFEEVFEQFLEFIGEEVLVGHNIASFDLGFLYRDAMKFWGKTLDNNYIDTLAISKVCLPHLAHHRLTDLASHYKLNTEGAHRALFDCEMNQKVFEYMAKDLQNPDIIKPRSCPFCGKKMKIRNGKFGEFWGCMGYPECRHTEPIKR